MIIKAAGLTISTMGMLWLSFCMITESSKSIREWQFIALLMQITIFLYWLGR